MKMRKSLSLLTAASLIGGGMMSAFCTSASAYNTDTEAKYALKDATVAAGSGAAKDGYMDSTKNGTVLKLEDVNLTGYTAASITYATKADAKVTVYVAAGDSVYSDTLLDSATKLCAFTTSSTGNWTTFVNSDEENFINTYDETYDIYIEMSGSTNSNGYAGNYKYLTLSTGGLGTYYEIGADDFSGGVNNSNSKYTYDVSKMTDEQKSLLCDESNNVRSIFSDYYRDYLGLGSSSGSATTFSNIKLYDGDYTLYYIGAADSYAHDITVSGIANGTIDISDSAWSSISAEGSSKNIYLYSMDFTLSSSVSDGTLTFTNDSDWIPDMLGVIIKQKTSDVNVTAAEPYKSKDYTGSDVGYTAELLVEGSKYIKWYVTADKTTWSEIASVSADSLTGTVKVGLVITGVDSLTEDEQTTLAGCAFGAAAE